MAVVTVVPLFGPVAQAGASGSHNPVGRLDRIELNDFRGEVYVFGWAADPDVGSKAVQVVLTTDGNRTVADGGAPRVSVMTGGLRPDVQRVYPQFGSHTGFSAQLASALGRGQHSVCAVGINQGLGADSNLGCVSYTLSVWSPGALLGHIDSAKMTPTGVVVAGWVMDPFDAESPTPFGLSDINACPNGCQSVGGFAADLPRPDVDRAYPHNGTDHGFVETLAIATTAAQYWKIGDRVCLARQPGGGGPFFEFEPYCATIR